VEKRTFTSAEASEIRRLLGEKAIANRDRQKTLRGHLRRDFDFYISNFAADPGGFTASDFDMLVARGTIEIRDTATPDTGEHERPTRARSDEQMTVLPDVLEPGLRVVFCGTAVGDKSARVGAYYAGPGNRFWRVLARVGLTPHELAPSDFAELPRYGIGLTDLARFVSGSDQTVSSATFDTDELTQNLREISPQAIAFNGKRAAEAFLNRSVTYGTQPESVSEATIFALPSTSAAARGFWDESHWKD
jgi:TDG/mug DNA glycosylase family protein